MSVQTNETHQFVAQASHRPTVDRGGAGEFLLVMIIGIGGPGLPDPHQQAGEVGALGGQATPTIRTSGGTGNRPPGNQPPDREPRHPTERGRPILDRHAPQPQPDAADFQGGAVDGERGAGTRLLGEGRPGGRQRDHQGRDRRPVHCVVCGAGANLETSPRPASTAASAISMHRACAASSRRSGRPRTSGGRYSSSISKVSTRASPKQGDVPPFLGLSALGNDRAHSDGGTGSDRQNLKGSWAALVRRSVGCTCAQWYWHGIAQASHGRLLRRVNRG